MSHFLKFSIDQQEYAINIAYVDRIIRIVEIKSLPQSLDGILGVINIHQKIVPVIDLRKKLGVTPKDFEISDEIILTHLDSHDTALLVDRVLDIQEFSDNSLSPATYIENKHEFIQSIHNQNEKMVFVCDLNKLIKETIVYDRV